MAKLTSKARNKLPSRDFAGPGRSYPVQDRSHAANAKARAAQQLKAGNLTKGQYNHIVRMANEELREDA
jgi:hypothetical protein